MHNSLPEVDANAQNVLNQLVLTFLQEQKRKRRYRFALRILLLLVFLFAFFSFEKVSSEDHSKENTPHAGVIDVRGEMADTASANADDFAKNLDIAYQNTMMKALIVRINSPGGSPVQANYMYNSIQYYRKKYPEVKIYSVCTDICASAAYYLAASTDTIYADESSMVGSIGVIYNGFGFVDLLQKIGVTRRLKTAGDNKGFLDPFSPLAPRQEALLQTMLNEVHHTFIEKVKQGRGERLHIDKDTFSGLFWTGTQAKKRGLIDGFASTGQLARQLDLPLVEYTRKQNLLEKLSKNIGTTAIEKLPAILGVTTGIKETLG